MTRPSYETAEDRDAEIRVAAFLEARWSDKIATLRKMPPYSSADFAGLDRGGEVRCYVEVRCRKNAYDAFETFFVEAAKLNALAQMVATSGVPVIFVVRWADKIGYFSVPSTLAFVQRWIQRSAKASRGDPADNTTVYEIPRKQISIFKLNQKEENTLWL